VDGQGSAALLRSPLGLAVDGAGNVYVADVYNNSIRRITDSGMVTTVVGVTAPRILGTMPGSLPASLASPAGVAMDLSRDRLYITVADAVLVAPIPN
jgi:DNA-binding beta-propeller fold protein YncE